MTLTARLDTLLARRGFTARPIRRVAAAAILLSAALLVLGALLLPVLSWPLWVGVGAVLSAWNFLSLAYTVQLIFSRNKGSEKISGKIMLAQLVGTNLRLFITGILVYVSLVSFSANVFALAGGLSMTVLLIPPLALGSYKHPDYSGPKG